MSTRTPSPAVQAAINAAKHRGEASDALNRVRVFVAEYARVLGNPEDRRAMFYAAEHWVARAHEAAHAAEAQAKPYERLMDPFESNGHRSVRPVWQAAEQARRYAELAAEAFKLAQA